MACMSIIDVDAYIDPLVDNIDKFIIEVKVDG